MTHRVTISASPAAHQAVAAIAAHWSGLRGSRVSVTDSLDSIVLTVADDMLQSPEALSEDVRGRLEIAAKVLRGE